ncbi:MAG: aconitate hydratase AcnA [Gammaproteobacteria bacterium]|nr:aconitate hydratase AcnA [Gammaproteobacteria bacterium]
MNSNDSYKTLCHLTIDDQQYDYFSLQVLEQAGFNKIPSLPYSIKILLENLLRHEDQNTVTQKDIETLANWSPEQQSSQEIAFRPARVLMQDFTGVPAVVDLGAMRDAIKALGGDPEKINPLTPVDLVIDHSIQVDLSGRNDAMEKNAAIEMQRNAERYTFLRWGQEAFTNFRVVPPETGICHQVNLENLAKTVWHSKVGDRLLAYPDTLVGTDSHTTMINGLGVLGWGVGGIEAEAAMLGQPISMLVPKVVGVELTGQLNEGVTATDLVLTITERLRTLGVVGKFVEFFGSGLAHLPVSDRATIANMAPEYGATCGFFPIDQATLNYLHLTGREEETIALVEAYAKAQGLWYDSAQPSPQFTEIVKIDLAGIKPSVAGPKRPQDRLTLAELKPKTKELLKSYKRENEEDQSFATTSDFELHHHDIVIAAITSCTNTSNPSVLMAAGLVAKKAVALGVRVKPWVKTSLAPGSRVVTQYLNASGLQQYLDQLGFDTVGYGCMTCIGNSGPLPQVVADSISENDIIVSAVLSGNRNFEGRIHPQVKANWLASPPLVVLFALAGTTSINLDVDPITETADGRAIYFKDLWPSHAEIMAALESVNRTMYTKQYANVFAGTKAWQQLNAPLGETYQWQSDSTYIQHPPYFENLKREPEAVKDIHQARILALLGDSITTDHISPAGSIKTDSPAGRYLQEQGVEIVDFNSYGARRGNHEVMVRGTFANIRIKNEMLAGTEGGFTKHFPSGDEVSIYDAAMRYKEEKVPLVIIAGKEYGTGSSRDWAAKGPKLQGVNAVIAESFERIHRSNLIGMGILPLEFEKGVTRKTLNLIGNETISILNINTLTPSCKLIATLTRQNGEEIKVNLISRIDTQNEMAYYEHGGILQYVLRGMVA